MAKFSAGVSVTRLRLGVSWRLYVVYVTWSTCLYLVAAQNPKCEDLPGCLTIQGRGACGSFWEHLCVTFIGCDTFDSSVVLCGLGSQQTTATGFEFCLPSIRLGVRIPVGVNDDNTEGPQNLGIEISGLDVTCERSDDVCDGNPGFELTFIAPPCPCICTEWSNWGACPTECGVTGTQQRTRSCDNTCDTESEENDCLVISCPTCSCTSWTNWRSCPRTCGVAASRRRTRVCSNNCDTQSDRKSCPFRNCDPTPAVWNGWSAWTPCQVSCGGSTQTRTRTCSNIRDIFDCPGSFTESQTCGEEPCPNCDCTIWSTWSTCSISCGTSQNRQRSRSCIDCFFTSTPVTDTSSCPGIPTVCLTAGVWAEWLQWTPCSVSCGGSIQSRTRVCATPDQDCPGSTQESRACGEGACPDAQAFSRRQRGRSGGQCGGRQRQGQGRQREGQGRERQGRGRQTRDQRKQGRSNRRTLG